MSMARQKLRFIFAVNVSFKEFNLERSKATLFPLQLDENLSVREALERVLRLPSVASKRYLTNKVWHVEFLFFPYHSLNHNTVRI